MPRITIAELVTLSQQALERAGASADAAASTARALVAMEAQGLDSHGVSRVPQCAAKIHRSIGAKPARCLPTQDRFRSRFRDGPIVDMSNFNARLRLRPRGMRALPGPRDFSAHETAAKGSDSVRPVAAAAPRAAGGTWS